MVKPRKGSAQIVRTRPLVVKLGGSLIDSLPNLVPVLCRSPRPVLVVPGGGTFADSIRRLDLRDETTSHWMAVAAMDQYGLLIASQGIPATDQLQAPEESTVLLPYRCVRW